MTDRSEITPVDKRRRRTFRELMFGTDTPDMDDAVDGLVALAIIAGTAAIVFVCAVDIYRMVFR